MVQGKINYWRRKDPIDIIPILFFVDSSNYSRYPLEPLTMDYLFRYQTVVHGVLYFKDIIFPNRENAIQFEREMMVIKNEVARINDVRDSVGRENYLELIRNWLHRCNQWIDQWGVQRVPVDIRDAVQSFQEVLQIPLTQFGHDSGYWH